MGAYRCRLTAAYMVNAALMYHGALVPGSLWKSLRIFRLSIGTIRFCFRFCFVFVFRFPTPFKAYKGRIAQNFGIVRIERSAI